MGKIGKPQKSKKHKKLKQTFDDDFRRKPKWEKGIKNLPPEKEDDDERMPRKVKNIMKSQQKMKSLNKKKLKCQFKNNKHLGDAFRMERGMTKPMEPAPKFIQMKGESDEMFLRRVNKKTNQVLLKSQIEDKYGVDLTDPEVSNQPYQKKKSERRKEKDRERKKKKDQARKVKILERNGDFSQFKDEVKFGEVAMEPPSLSAKPRKAIETDEKSRSGKSGLLLNQLIKGDSAEKGRQSEEVKSSNKPKNSSERQAGQTVKRKFLSPAQQRITDLQRQRAIDMYRKMKDTKIKQS